MSEARNIRTSKPPLIPDKLYFRIGEVARLLGVETHTLRFWETEFPQLKVGKGGTGQRLYRRRDVELVFEIKHLLYEQGYTIPGARQLLQSRRKENPDRKAAPTASAVSTAGQTVRPDGPSLDRIRSGLRDLSNLLSDADPSVGSSSMPSSRTRSPMTASARSGLHLAARSPAKQRDVRPANKPAASHTLPSLFGPEGE